MREKGIAFAVTALIALFIAGCSQTEANNQKHAEHKAPEVLQVEIGIEKSDAKVNENIVFEAKVTQGGEPVEDAKEVEFEFSREGDEDTEMIKVIDQENGIYRLEKSFSEDGRYTITTHVTARDMHSMPSEEFSITP